MVVGNAEQREYPRFAFLVAVDLLQNTLYSGVGLGISTLYGSLIPAIQFTVFGVSFGKKVFGFVETGGGTEYFSVHGGIGYRF